MNDRAAPLVDREQFRGLRRQPAAPERAVEGGGVVANGADVMHSEVFPVMPGLGPGIHVFSLGRYNKQDVDGRDKPGHDELNNRPQNTIRHPYSAGLASGVAPAALAAASAAAFFSTRRTDQIEPSYRIISGSASESWLITSGGVSTAAMTKAPTMK